MSQVGGRGTVNKNSSALSQRWPQQRAVLLGPGHVFWAVPASVGPPERPAAFRAGLQNHMGSEVTVSSETRTSVVADTLWGTGPR